MKHRYSRLSRRFVVLFCLFSLLVTAVNVVGISRYGYISISNFLLLFSSLFSTFITTFYILLGYEQFDIIRHKLYILRYQLFVKYNLPEVDIFLPCAGEDCDLLRRTYLAVRQISYPCDKLKVYVLDDYGSEDIKILSEAYGFTYLSRPNKGYLKKAGNLQFGFTHSQGKYILVLDADFAPKPEILHELIPYMEGVKSVGICVTPQDFELNSKAPMYVQKGDIGIQEFFYRICQTARNTYNAAICTGTNALYRRIALDKGGGFYQIEHSEDSHTGLNLVNSGFRILYIPLVLAIGYCPSSYFALYKQRSRWCQGSITLARSKLFLKARLSLMGRLCYVSGFYYYLNSFVILTLPFHTLYLLFTPEKSTFIDTLFFIPSIIYMILSYWNFYYPRFSFSVLGNQFFYYWTYAFIIVRSFILGKKESWQATGSLRHKNQAYRYLILLIVIYIALYWSVFISISSSVRFQFALNDYVVLFWIIFNLTTHISFITGLVVTETHHFRNVSAYLMQIVNKTRLGSTPSYHQLRKFSLPV